ncbi:HAD-IA family hydrolase [Candidatus Saccharibacteria bacterium]|nr:HAD-IA family hydrolase [Candidatus Saccharibacteria bacterium]
MDEVGLGKSLQKARQAAGLTQQQLCQKAGLSYSTLAKIERGAIKSPSIFTIQSIAASLGLTLTELMGEITPRVAEPVQAPKKRSKSGVRFVYFDINGCLVRFFHRAFTRLAEDSGAPADLVETTFWHYNDAVCRGEMNMDEFNRIFAERIGINTLNWMEYYLSAIDPIDEMQELVSWASENYYVGLLSNIMPGFIDAMVERSILPKVAYASIIDSSKTGSIKPEQQIYEAAQAYASGCAPTEILLIDDSRANLMAAEKLGWKVLWFDDYRPDESIVRVRSALEFEEVQQAA